MSRKGKRSPARVLFERKPQSLSQPSRPAFFPLRPEDFRLLPDEQPRSSRRGTRARGLACRDPGAHTFQIRDVGQPELRTHRAFVAKSFLFMPHGFDAPPARHALRRLNPVRAGLVTARRGTGVVSARTRRSQIRSGMRAGWKTSAVGIARPGRHLWSPRCRKRITPPSAARHEPGAAGRAGISERLERESGRSLRPGSRTPR